MRRIVSALGVCGLLLTASACGERSEPTGSSVDVYPITVTGSEGAATRVDSEPKRILAAGPEMGSTLRALGVRPVVATARTQPVGRFDLVLAWASSEDRGAVVRRSADGAPVYVAADRSLDDVERSVAEIGLLVGKPLAGRRLAERIERERRSVATRLREVPAVSVFLDTGFFHTVSSRSLPGDMIREARGDNVAGPTPEPGPFDLLVLAKENPQYYLATSDSERTLPGLRRNPAMRRLDAVREGRFGIVAASLLEPGPNVGLGVEELARLMHPDAFR